MGNSCLAAWGISPKHAVTFLVVIAVIGLIQLSNAAVAGTNPHFTVLQDGEQYQEYPSYPTETSSPTPIPTPSPTPEPKITPGSPLTLGGSTLAEFIQRVDIFQIAAVVLASLVIVWLVVIFVYTGKAIVKKAA